MFFNKEELVARFVRRNRNGEWGGSTVCIHSNTKCKLSGFLAVGPIYKGTGFAWFDIRVAAGSPVYFELDRLLKEVCEDFPQYQLKYQEAVK